MLLNQVLQKDGIDRTKLLNSAKTILLKGDSLKKGACAYNLACCTSLMGENEACEKWLILSKETNNPPEKSHFLEDSILANVRDEEWFKNFINTLE